MIFVGALAVGDSVRFSLKQAALRRLGPITHAYAGGNRFIDAALADRLAQHGVPCAPLILLPGVVLADTPDGRSRQVNNVQVFGVDARFQRFSGCGDSAPAPDVLVNPRLAAALNLHAGMELSVRVPRPGLLPDDAPLSSRRESSSVRGRFTIRAIVADDRLGNFSIQTDQAEPYNVFVPLAWLQAQLGRTDQANLLAAAVPTPAAAGAFRRALLTAWRPESAGYRFGTNAAGCVQVQSSEVFLTPGVTTAITTAVPTSVAAFTYLVNSLSTGAAGAMRSVPYSFVTALSPCADRTLGIVPAGMRDDEILLNRWTADELRAEPGDTVTLRYFRIEPAAGLTETSRLFRVRGVAAMNDLRRERDLVPDFPGLSDVEACRDWDIGMPMEEAALNDPRNEVYWKHYRQTPKALVTWRAGREMWGSRFGEATGIRCPAAGDVVQAARSAITPDTAGIGFAPVRELALRAVSQATDIGGLMLGMSGFLILAAILLTLLIVSFAIQQRANHLGCLLAMGGRPRYLFALTALETLVAALCGAIAGVPAGLLYARVMTHALGSTWRDAVAGAHITFHAEPATVVIGAASTLLVIAAAVAASVLRLLRSSPVRLLTWDATQDEALLPTPRRRRGAFLLVVLTAASVALLLWARLAGASRPEPYFYAGCCLLLAALQAFSYFLTQEPLAGGCPAALTLRGAVWRNLTRRRRRSMAVVAALASGAYLVLAVGTMQSASDANPTSPASGTGGFMWYAESTLPLFDAASAGHRRREDGTLQTLAPFDTLCFKLHDGDHAGCLNLNRAQSPRVIGVPADGLARRGAFATDAGSTLWARLKAAPIDGALPALAADMDTLQWGLKFRADPEHGDTLQLTDDRGRHVRVRLVGALPRRQTVFHGSLLVSLDAFQRLYPSEAGYRLFLLNPGRGAGAAKELDALTRVGLDVQRGVERLAVFHRVEATYLSMFLLLGGLGLLLGSGGLGLVLLRNVMERRHELAILEAVGFRETRIRQLVGLEHAVLLCAGLIIGCGAAGVSMIPAARQAAEHVPWAGICVLVAGMSAFGAASLFVTLLATTRHRNIAAALSAEDE